MPLPAQVVSLQELDLASQVVAVLREHIVAGDLAPSERLVESVLASELGVSRGPVRDALRILQDEGLVVRSRHGAEVVALSSQDIEELYELRAAIEVRAIRLLSGRKAPYPAERLTETLAAMEVAAQSNDAHTVRRLDLALHEQIYELCLNRRLLETFRRLKPIMWLVNRSRHQLFQSLDEVVDEHRPLVEALVSGDTELAERLTEEHLGQAKELMLRVRREGSGTEMRQEERERVG